MTDEIDDAVPGMDAAGPTQYEKLRAIPWNLAYDLANTFFIQLSFFGTVFILFLDDLGLDESQIGLMLSILPFLGLMSLFIARPIAQAGYKRSFLLSMTARTIFTAGLLVVPWLAMQFDAREVSRYVALVTLAFAISRAVTLTAYLPWQQEFIPHQMRGRYSGYSNVIINVAGLIAIAIAGFLLASPLGIWRYAILFGIGVAFSALCVWMASRFPGGAPVADRTSIFQIDERSFIPLRDTRFIRYLVTLGLITLGMGPIFLFLPLFMKDKVGLDPGSIAILQTGGLIGSLISSYFWGWLADRYGSKPISLTGLLMTVLLPVFWLLMPRGSTLSFPIALGISFFAGIAGTGWTVGSDRFLFVTIVSPENRKEYLSQFSAWTGLLSGAGSILGGILLRDLAAVQVKVFNLNLDSYSVLFGIGFLVTLVAATILSSVRAPRETSLGEFAGLFFRGNPWSAISSVIRFYYAREESDVLAATQRLGMTRSPLTVEELIHSLNDPRFYVRFEAIVSMTQQRPNDRLVDALIEVLDGPDPALSSIAAWALGRMRNPTALQALRNAFRGAKYKSVQAHAARALGSLHDLQSVPLLLECVKSDSDLGLKVACASSLGKLQAVESTSDLLQILYIDQYPQSQSEMGLALARLLGMEDKYVELSRKVSADLGTALAQEMENLRQGARSNFTDRDEASINLTDAREYFAREQVEDGLQSLLLVMDVLTSKSMQPTCQEILSECGLRMGEFGQSRLEYTILAIIALQKCGI